MTQPPQISPSPAPPSRESADWASDRRPHQITIITKLKRRGIVRQPHESKKSLSDLHTDQCCKSRVRGYPAIYPPLTGAAFPAYLRRLRDFHIRQKKRQKQTQIDMVSEHNDLIHGQQQASNWTLPPGWSESQATRTWQRTPRSPGNPQSVHSITVIPVIRTCCKHHIFNTPISKHVHRACYTARVAYSRVGAGSRANVEVDVRRGSTSAR